MFILGSELLLDVQNLHAGYGKVPVLHNVSLQIRPGEALALLGPNGAGKSTLLKAISGLIPWSAGTVHFLGGSLNGATARMTSKRGLVHVIEGHRVFTDMSVLDNLMLAGFDLLRAERASRIEEALSFFPELVAKRADRASLLSGGQQQMLAVAQGIVRRPKLLLLDEPSAGLSPILVDRVLAVATQLKAQGTAILLVEQLVEKSIKFADRVCAMAQGKLVLDTSARAPDLLDRIQTAYFGSPSTQQ